MIACLLACGAGKVYVQLSPQQLPMLDLLRLLRARRKTEPAAAAWADQQLKDNGANLDKVGGGAGAAVARGWVGGTACYRVGDAFGECTCRAGSCTHRTGPLMLCLWK